MHVAAWSDSNRSRRRFVDDVTPAVRCTRDNASMTRLATLVILGLTACGGGGSGGGDVTPDKLAGTLAHSSCSKLSSCCTADEFKAQTLGATSEAQCEALIGGFGELFAKTLQDSISKGRVIYHADRMGDCIAVIDAASCIEYQNFTSGSFPGGSGSGCQDPFEGQVVMGGDCAQDFDCTSAYCSGDSVDQNGTITFGKCAVLPPIGQPCDDSNCAAGAFCDSANSCQATKADGASCSTRAECTSAGCNGTPGTCGVTMTCDGN
jgi:hypothetical protein